MVVQYPVQQTTSGTGHRVKYHFFFGLLATNTLIVRNNNQKVQMRSDFSLNNGGVLYFLDYVQDICITVLSVLVSTLNLNHMYLPLLLTLYCIALYTYKLGTRYNNKGLSIPVSFLNPKSYVISTTNIRLILLLKI